MLMTIVSGVLGAVQMTKKYLKDIKNVEKVETISIFLLIEIRIDQELE